MILFYLKKNFCDGWDNLLWIIVNNLICIAVVAATYLGLSYLATGTLGTDVATVTEIMPVPALIACSVVLGVAGVWLVSSLILSISDSCAKIADFKSPSYKELFKNLKNCWKDGILFALLNLMIAVLALIGIPFYLSMGGLFGLFLGSLVFWALVVTILAMQWFLPLRSQLKGGFIKTLKKSYIILFDNFGFSLLMGIYSLVLIALSVFLVGIVPSFGGLALAQNNALRIRMYKYDWLEEHPEVTPKEARKIVPWGELIGEDRDTLGPRSIRSFFFPWKD
ncbi:MAG: hypothetical protein MJ183_03450 [Treponemataceae bacterium]|nr:hypothetical protein [Treponemataceae bacterium]